MSDTCPTCGVKCERLDLHICPKNAAYGGRGMNQQNLFDPTKFHDVDCVTAVDYPMTRSPKQEKIMAHLRDNKTISLDEATALVGTNVYYNKKKYVGQVLSRMNKAGLIERVKPGLYKKQELEGDHE